MNIEDAKKKYENIIENVNTEMTLHNEICSLELKSLENALNVLRRFCNHFDIASGKYFTVCCDEMLDKLKRILNDYLSFSSIAKSEYNLNLDSKKNIKAKIEMLVNTINEYMYKSECFSNEITSVITGAEQLLIDAKRVLENDCEIIVRDYASYVKKAANSVLLQAKHVSQELEDVKRIKEIEESLIELSEKMDSIQRKK